LEQTRAIVAQVEHEITQQAARQSTSRPGLLLVPSRKPQTIAADTSATLRSAGRFVLSLIPAGSL